MEYLDRVEECHGFHEVWELEGDSYNEAIEDVVENYDSNDIIEWLYNQLTDDFWIDEDEEIVEIIEVKSI